MTANILIIDDEANLRSTLAMILRSGGYTAFQAGTAVDALKLLGVQTFQLVFLDLQLPDMNGIDLLRHIRDAYPDLPVLMLTGNGTLDTSIQAIRQGARDYMLKPLEPEYILVRTGEILQETQQPQRRREITRMIQDLMSELHGLDAAGPSPAVDLQAVPPADPHRFLQIGKLKLDLHARHCFVSGQFIQVPSSTFDYLVVLAKHSPDTVSPETLVLEAQGYKVSGLEASELARWQVHELRKVLEPGCSRSTMIITVRGAGYRLVA